MELFQIQTFLNPPILHAITVHFPVALAILGIPIIYFTAVATNERNSLLWLSVTTYVLLTITSFLAVQAGHRAASALPSNLSKEITTLLNRHEELAEKVWILSGALVVVLFFSFIKVKFIRITALIIAMLGSLIIGGWIIATAHLGGTMVYSYCVGTPCLQQPSKDISPLRNNNPPQINKQTEESAETLVPIRPIDPKAAEEVSYVRDIKPIMEKFCIECHGQESPASGLSLIDVTSMQKGGLKAGPGIIPHKPDESSIVRYISGELKPRMPKNKPPLSETDLHVLRCWIAAGAIDDSNK